MKKEGKNLAKTDKEIDIMVSIENTLETIKMINSDPTIINKDLNNLNYRLLDRAADVGNFDLVKYIIEKDPESVNYYSANTESDALECALKNRHIKIAEFLIENNSVIAMRNNGNSTHPLFFLIFNSEFDLSKKYMEKYNISPILPLSYNDQPAWSIPMINYNSNDPLDFKKSKIEFFKYCTNKMRPGDLSNIPGFNWLDLSITNDQRKDFFDELLRLQASLEIGGPATWSSNPLITATKARNEYITKLILKNFQSVPSYVPQNIAPDKLMQHYLMISFKWERLLDIFTLKVFSEFNLKVIDNINSVLANNEQLKNALQKIQNQKRMTAIFRVNRHVFSKIINYLPLYPTEMKKDENDQND